MCGWHVGLGDLLEYDVATQSLVGRMVKSEEEAFKLYNDYLYKMGFSVLNSKKRVSLALKSNLWHHLYV